jgi:hypothetical protein
VKQSKIDAMTTKKFLILGFLAFLLQLTHQLPVKEAPSTEKTKTEEADSPTQNLENIIGEFPSRDKFPISSSLLRVFPPRQSTNDT